MWLAGAGPMDIQPVSTASTALGGVVPGFSDPVAACPWLCWLEGVCVLSTLVEAW